MKEKWLNLVLKLTNRVYQYKQLIITQSGLRVISLVFKMIFSELFLGLVSLPLYITLRSNRVTAFFAEKGAYEKIAFDYNLRRVLTLTGVGIVAFIWALKIVIMLAVPRIYGEPRLFSVANFRLSSAPASTVTAEASIRAAKVGKDLAPPQFSGIRRLAGGDYTFFGKAQTGLSVVALLSDQQTIVYTSDVKQDGSWEIDHSQNIFRLSPGNHSIIVFVYDKGSGLRSESAPEQFFKAADVWWDALAKSLDIIANVAIIVVIVVGLFLIFLTI